jgi:hypothetical protein
MGTATGNIITTLRSTGRGGARPGAGRKPGWRKPNTAHRVRRMIMLSDEELNQARALGQGNISAGVRLALTLSQSPPARRG